ncbi:glycoside hydrolase family 9 protein [Cytophagaceae bacterium ABcell3]|nr:glycoside hydrolase family 9 protein [Cytophagaceae bacterium ABcell3]
MKHNYMLFQKFFFASKVYYQVILLSMLFFSNAVAQSDFIVIDQFGYRTTSEKVAVIRDPQTGFDEGQSFNPGSTYALVNAESGEQVFTAEPEEWNGGIEDESSGDRAWWFDFSEVTEPGTYYVEDVDQGDRSFEFEIRDDVYNSVLKHAFRTFFYQRAGFAKEAPYAETGWEDGASHLGPLQDANCRSYDAPDDASTEKDLRGGWYDAGDYNKYTNWTSNYIYEMFLAYLDNPEAWGDDFDIPESGNGIPDILDEAKWGMDHLLRLQNDDGSMISVVSLSHASPPSSATGPSLYGGVNTSATNNSASTFAFGAKVFGALGMNDYADQLLEAAKKAWGWADENPNVIWRNNDEAYGSQGIASGQQETNDYGRFAYKMRAAVHLFEMTGEESYKSFFDENYQDIHLIPWNYAFPFEVREQEVLLYYTTLEDATTSVVREIKDKYADALNTNEFNFPAYHNINTIDPYMAPLENYVWGSNGTKSNQGTIFYDLITYDIEPSQHEDARRAAERFIHYIHGVNPLNMVYLSNMYGKGGDKCVNQFYHTWFHDGTELWDEVGVSTYGPAPGFLVGGPNPEYDWDDCCPDGCGSMENNAVCTSISLSPPKDQPDQKSYLDFNTTWPLNSWEVTENSCGYQTAYIRLLSKFVQRTNPPTLSVDAEKLEPKFTMFPNPATSKLSIKIPDDFGAKLLSISSVQGARIMDQEVTKNKLSLDIHNFSAGIYLVRIDGDKGTMTQKLVVH